MFLRGDGHAWTQEAKGEAIRAQGRNPLPGTADIINKHQRLISFFRNFGDKISSGRLAGAVDLIGFLHFSEGNRVVSPDVSAVPGLFSGFKLHSLELQININGKAQNFDLRHSTMDKMDSTQRETLCLKAA